MDGSELEILDVVSGTDDRMSVVARCIAGAVAVGQRIRVAGIAGADGADPRELEIVALWKYEAVPVARMDPPHVVKVELAGASEHIRALARVVTFTKP
jgi:hypothetical protein